MMRLLLADDHTMLRECLRRALEQAGHTVVAEAGDGDEAVRLAYRHRPHVAVLDVGMPVLDGLAAARRISSLGTPVVVLTMLDDDDTRSRAAAAGVTAVLGKDCTTGELLEALRAAALPAEEDGRPSPARPCLSRREAEVLRLLAQGATPGEIAERLYIAPVTVKNHLAAVYRKLGCHSRADAVVYALRHGMAPMPSPV